MNGTLIPVATIASPMERHLYPTAEIAHQHFFGNQSLNIDNNSWIKPSVPFSYIDPYEIFEPYIFDRNYYISNFGRIYSLKFGDFLTPQYNQDGYLQVSLTINRHRQPHRVHRMIMMTFAYKENCENLEVNHLNGIKDQNVYYPGHVLHNLEWCTHKENIIHSIEMGLRDDIGENNPSAKYTNDEIHQICKIMQDNPQATYIDIAKILNYEPTKQFNHFISHIRTGQIWTSISQNYNIKLAKSSNFSVELVQSIKGLLRQDKTEDQIIEILNLDNTYCNKRRIRDIQNGKTYRFV